jgi:hypothetical protein
VPLQHEEIRDGEVLGDGRSVVVSRAPQRGRSRGKICLRAHRHPKPASREVDRDGVLAQAAHDLVVRRRVAVDRDYPDRSPAGVDVAQRREVVGRRHAALVNEQHDGIGRAYVVVDLVGVPDLRRDSDERGIDATERQDVPGRPAIRRFCS